MIVIQASPGEMIYDYLKRCIVECNKLRVSTVIAKHNDTEVYVYADSNICDLCDKFDLTRTVWQLRNPACHGGY